MTHVRPLLPRVPATLRDANTGPAAQTAKPAAGRSVLDALDEAMARTAALVAPLSDEDYRKAHHAVLGPIAWDVAHMTQQADLWLVQTLGGRSETRAGYNERYDAYRNPRPGRAALPLLDRNEVAVYRGEVRTALREVYADTPRATDDRRWRGDWLHWMVVTHEHQHDETILQGLAALPARYAPPLRAPHRARLVSPASLDGFAHVEGGRAIIGAPPYAPCTYDNEWPPHEVDVAPFWLARAPVTNGQFLAFMEDGGYDERRWWAPEGWQMVTSDGLEHPLYWERGREGWRRRVFDETRPLALDEPVCHVSWYEADAYARWSGLRLPTETEWETAATWDVVRRQKRAWPWGAEDPTPDHANLDHAHWGPQVVGAYPRGATPQGIQQLVGDVWEWTATTFGPYPGFSAFPYRDYSERFFGDRLKVLRGGSWAARPGLRFGTFRNWDLPIRRQIFAGLRLAADGGKGPENEPRPRGAS